MIAITDSSHFRRTLRDYPHGTTPLGGYPLAYYTADSGMLCPECASAERTLISEHTRFPCDPAWKVVAVDVLYEGEHYCDHCGDRMAVAYPED